jgi:hypothetical protein
VFSCFFPSSTVLHKICWWKTTCKNSPRTNCWWWKTSCKNSKDKFAGGKLLVRTHQGWILLHKIAVENNMEELIKYILWQKFSGGKLVKNSTSKLN